MTQGTLDKILAGADREARRVAWEGYMDTYLAYKNTLAANLLTSVKYNVFSMRARRHTSTLEMALAEHNTPIEVFHNLIATFQRICRRGSATGRCGGRRWASTSSSHTTSGRR